MKKVFSLVMALALSMTCAFAETFIKVTDASTLNNGDKVVMGCAAKNEVSAGFSSTKKFLDGVTATFANDKVTVDNPTIITLKKNGDYWNLYFGTKVIGHNSGSSDLDGSKCRYTTNFAISIAANGTANIVSQTPGDKNAEVFFNHHNTDSRFSLYKASSNQTPIELYKLDESTIVEKVPTSVTLNKTELEMRVGDAAQTLTTEVLPADAVDKSVTWGSSNTGIITVANGVVTPVAVGEAYVWVKTNKGENVTDTCWITILPALDNTEVTYKAVQKADYLPAGAKVFFGTVKDGENYVMGLYASGNNIKGIAATYGEKHHSVTAKMAYAYTVEKDGSYYLFKDQDGKYLRTNSTTKLGSGNKDDYAKWTLGAFDEDDATVLLTNYKNNSSSIYNNFQGTNDLFNVYNNPGTDYCAKVVLYSDKAQDWEDRVKEPKMEISGADVTKVGDKWVIDYGEIEADPYVSAGDNPFYDSRKVTVNYGDLTDNIAVTITGANATTFNLPISGDEIKSAGKKTGSQELTIYWEADSKGTYTATLTFHTATTGIDDIVVTLTAKAVDKSSDPQYQPSLTLSKKTMYLNPNYTGEGTPCTDMDGFTFSAKNLAKKLYVKWEHTSDILFKYKYENSCMSILAGSYSVALNGSVEYPAGTDITDEEVYASIDGLTSEGKYTTKLHFYSYKEDSKTELAIDEYVTITINMTTDPTPDPTTAIDNVNTTIGTQKFLRDGQIIIIRNNVEYGIDGKRL